MIPVTNAARQENSRRSVRIADMLRLPPFMPRQNKAWHSEGRFVYRAADGKAEKLQVA
jgi:hypothetical protein